MEAGSTLSDGDWRTLHTLYATTFELKGNHATGVTLLHVRFVPTLPAAVARTVLEGYRERYQLLADWITETEVAVRDDLLSSVPTVDLLTLPVSELADHWRS